jgi:hypothetical protein
MRSVDVTVESDHGVFRLYPETERGRAWLAEYGARADWSWERGALAVLTQAATHKAIISALDAGLEVESFPRDSRLKGRITDNDETVH